jgi:prevent-host-death family protein
MLKTELTVTATEARHSFSKLLRIVRDGGRVTITAYGKAVAELVPIRDRAAQDTGAGWKEKLDELQARWARTPTVTVSPWTRDSLYDDD